MPIFKNQTKAQVLAYAEQVKESLGDLRIKLDADDQNSPGWKFSEWEMLGVPVRIEIGPRDVDAGKVVLVRRDTGEKSVIAKEEAPAKVRALLGEIQSALYNRALEFRKANTHELDDYDKLKELYGGEGGFAVSSWCGEEACEIKIKDETKATIRVLLDESNAATGSCIVCGKPGKQTAVFAKAY